MLDLLEMVKDKGAYTWSEESYLRVKGTVKNILAQSCSSSDSQLRRKEELRNDQKQSTDRTRRRQSPPNHCYVEDFKEPKYCIQGCHEAGVPDLGCSNDACKDWDNWFHLGCVGLAAPPPPKRGLVLPRM